MSINGPLADVRAFHLAFGHPVADSPTPLTFDRAKKRADWVRDECDELIEDTASIEADMAAGAAGEADMIAVQVDAVLDAIYFSLGTVVELGLDLAPLWKIVQDANMAKLHEIDGKLVAVKDANGKTIKPEGWTDPHPLIVAEIRRQTVEKGLRLAA